MQDSEFYEIYKDLARLYSGRMKSDSDTMDSWYKRLNDIPTKYVTAAIDQLVNDESVDVRYPPNALQIRRIARQLSGSTSFESLQTDEGDQLRADMWRLELETDAIEPLLWERAAVSLRNVGRGYAAEAMERRYQGELQPIDGALYLSWHDLP